MLVTGPLVKLDAVIELTPKLHDVEAEDEKGEVPEVEDGMEVVLEPNRKGIDGVTATDALTARELKPKSPLRVVVEIGVLAKDQKLKTRAGTDEGITGVGVEVEKIAAGVRVVVVVDITMVVVSPRVSSTGIASSDTTTTVISTTTTTPTPAAIFSTSTPTPVIPSSVLAPVFSFWSATSTTPTISEAKTGNTSVTNDKDLKSNLTNSPFASTPISTTTRSGLFGFSSPAVTSTTNNQSQTSFFNVSNGSQANTQASVAVTPSMSFLFGSMTTSIPSSTSGTSPYSSPASTSSSFGVSSITASNSIGGPATSIFWSTWDPKRAYGFGTTYNDHMSTESMEGDSMQTSTLVFDMSVDSMVAEDTHVHGTDMSVDSMVAEDTHVHGTGATLNNYDHTHMDMMVEDCMQTPTGETSMASPLFSFNSGTQPLFSSYALHLDWWPAKSNW
nr:hypothetical protein [Tanacetum cinerariifolium]